MPAAATTAPRLLLLLLQLTQQLQFLYTMQPQTQVAFSLS
jgi:hypothetical protein